MSIPILRKVKLLTIFICCCSSVIIGQNAEQEIMKVVNEINNDIESVHQLASQKRIYDAIAKLDKIYSKLNHERQWGTFDEKYKEAKRSNPSFTYKIRKDLPPQLEATYWKSKEEQCKRILANQDVVIEGMKAARSFNNEEKFISLLKQLKTGYDAISGIIENAASANFIKLGYDLHGNFNDAIDNYKNYEEADLKNLELDAKMAKFNLTIAKAEKNKSNFKSFQNYLKDNYDAVVDFKINVDYLNKIKNTIDSGPIDKLSFVDHKYNWNYGPFQKEVEELVKNFKIEDDYCADFKREYEEINTSAKKDLAKVIKNIEASDDNENKQKFLKENNAKWSEYFGVVNPKFTKAYKNNCEKTKQQQTSANEITNNSNLGNNTTVKAVNDRFLKIESLEIENSYGVSTNSFNPGQQAKVRFTTKWEGKWLEHVQLKILLDNEVVLDEIHSFRNSMGDFSDRFSKTILIPSHFGNGAYNLSLYISRDPKILNKSIQVKCTPKTIKFNVVDTSNQTTTQTNEEDEGEEENKDEEIVKEVKNTTKPSITYSGSSDKYWENEIPDNATKDWAILKEGISTSYEVKYSVNGRTVGYRVFSDAEFKKPLSESIRNNIAVKHGVQRRFSFDKEGNYFVYEIEFYRANKQVGPVLKLNEKGIITNPDALSSYKANQAKDNSMHPVEAYHQVKIAKYIPTELQLSLVQIANTGNVDYASINIPSNPIKLIRNSSSGYFEKYYSSNVLKQHVGTYNFSGEKLRSATKRSGRKVVSWSFGYNNLNAITTYLLNDKYLYNQDYYTDDKIKVGKRISKDKTAIYLFGKVTDEQSYLNAKAKNNWLPALDDTDAILKQPFKFQNYPDPVWATTNPLNLFIEDGSKLWKVVISSTATYCIYVKNNNISGRIKWIDKKQRLLEVYRDMHRIYNIQWSDDGTLFNAHISGHIEGDGLKIAKKNGEIVPTNYDKPEHYSYSSNYGNIKNTPSLEVLNSSRLNDVIDQPKFPQAEVTPLFKDIWNGVEVDYSSPTFESLSEQNQFDNIQTEQSDSKEEDNYQELQRQEFFTLAQDVQKIIEKADASFNKKYWEDPNSSRVTINETNPKQEAFDILRSALPVIKKAKYPENEASINNLLAMKFTEYSGRVFGFRAKQEFFLEATKLINRSDQLIPQIKHLKSKADLSEMYCLSAEVWRDMTRKAQWGNHEYNKMACDKKVIEQYELAIQTDPNNQKARRILEGLKAPKKAVPEVVEKFEKLPDETWNKAEMVRLENEEEIYKEPEVNPIMIAEMTLTIQNGSVSIKRSGAEDWEVVSNSHIPLFTGDVIKTSADAKGVSITYNSNKAFLAIKNSAEVKIIGENYLMISRGGAMVQVEKKGSKFVVVTHAVNIGVRGTEFEVKVADDKSTETFLYEGVVETRNSSEVGYLVPGEKMSAKKGESKLNQSAFNASQRKTSIWGNLEQQRTKHEQIKALNPISRNESLSISANDPIVQNVMIAASPDRNYHSVLVATNLDYQYKALVARCAVNVRTKTALTVNWYYNNQSQPISIGNYEVLPQASKFDAVLFSNDKPLNPGVYKTEFVMNSSVIGNGTVKIKTQELYSEQEAQKYYIEAVKAMDMALQFLNGGNYTNAGELARSSLPILQSVMYNAPNLPDVFAVLQAAQTIIAMDEVNNLLQQNETQKALEWAKVSLASVNTAHQNCKDYQFKQTLTNLKKVVEEIVFELKKL